MKIAMIITSLEVGGAEKMVLNLIRELQEKAEIRLFIIRKNYQTIYDRQLTEMKIKYYYLNAANPLFSIKAYKKLKQLLDEYDPDIIHSHLKAADYVFLYRLRKKSVPWIHTVHTLAEFDVKHIRRLFYRPLYKKGIIISVSVSEEVDSSLFRLYGIRGRIIPNGVDLEKFKYLPEEKTEFQVLHVGRFIALKNHKYLITEFAKFANKKKDVKLILIGSGPLKKKMQRLVRKMEISKQVKFVGHTSNVEQFMREACVFVLPSRYEGMSLALLEALASGLLVITRRNLTSLIENEVNGFEIDIEKNALFYELENLYENYGQLEIVRRNAEKSVSEFSLKQTAERYYKLYEELIHD